jgi:hypothetical protein
MTSVQNAAPAIDNRNDVLERYFPHGLYEDLMKKSFYYASFDPSDAQRETLLVPYREVITKFRDCLQQFSKAVSLRTHLWEAPGVRKAASIIDTQIALAIEAAKKLKDPEVYECVIEMQRLLSNVDRDLSILDKDALRQATRISDQFAALAGVIKDAREEAHRNLKGARQQTLGGPQFNKELGNV